MVKKELTKQQELLAQPAKTAEFRDELLDAAWEQYDNILMMYEMFADLRPVILFDIQDQRVYAYPYKEFRAEMNERSQGILEQQYERAQVDGQIVVFVRDKLKQKFRSFSLDRN